MKIAIKKGLALAPVVIAGALAVTTPNQASDHIDGIKTSLDNAADVTDVYAFTSPSDPGKLVLIMNVHTLAWGKSRFSNAVDYEFRIRPIDDPIASREQRIVCTFSGGLALVDAKQHAECTLYLADGSETISFSTRSGTYRAGGAGESGGTRVFAGVRSDPWFLDLAKTLKFNAGLPTVGPGINGLWGQNVLSIVVEVDKTRLGGPLLAVTGQTVRR